MRSLSAAGQNLASKPMVAVELLEAGAALDLEGMGFNGCPVGECHGELCRTAGWDENHGVGGAGGVGSAGGRGAAAALVDGGAGEVGGLEVLAGGGGGELGEEVFELIEEGGGAAEELGEAFGQGAADGDGVLRGDDEGGVVVGFFFQDGQAGGGDAVGGGAAAAVRGGDGFFDAHPAVPQGGAAVGQGLVAFEDPQPLDLGVPQGHFLFRHGVVGRLQGGLERGQGDDGNIGGRAGVAATRQRRS